MCLFKDSYLVNNWSPVDLSGIRSLSDESSNNYNRWLYNGLPSQSGQYEGSR